MPVLAIVDDHAIPRAGMISLLRSFGYELYQEANNGVDFIEKFDENSPPDLVLMDVHMPIMDGYQTTAWLKINFPSVKVLALTMLDNDLALIKMLKCGARGYVVKNATPQELKEAIDSVLTKGYHYSEKVNGKLINAINNDEKGGYKNNLSDREIEFLKLACSELTYKEIAAKMFISHRTVDGYREALFEKLQVKTRVGLAVYAIKHGYVIL